MIESLGNRRIEFRRASPRPPQEGRKPKDPELHQAIVEALQTTLNDSKGIAEKPKTKNSLETEPLWEGRRSKEIKALITAAQDYLKPDKHHQAWAKQLAADYLRNGVFFYETYFDVPIKVSPMELNAFITLLDDARLESRDRAAQGETFFATLNALEHDNPSALIDRRLDAIMERRTKTDVRDFIEKNIAKIRPEYIKILIENQNLTHLPGWDAPILGAILDKTPDYLDSLSDAELLELELGGDSLEHDPLASLKDRAAAEVLKTQFHGSDIHKPNNVSSEAILTKISPEFYGAFDRAGRLTGVFGQADERARDLYEVLFNTHVLDDVPEADKPVLAANLSSLVDLRLRSHLEEDYGISFTDLSLREQLALLRTLETSSPEEDKRQTELIHDFGLPAARAFLACEGDEIFRSVILNLPERHDDVTTRQIFDKYAEIVNLAQTTAEQMGEQFFADTAQTAFNYAEVQQTLLVRAKNILVQSFAETDPNNTLKLLEQTKVDLMLTGAMFKEVRKKNPELKFEDMRGASREVRAPVEISDEDKQAMTQIFDDK